MKQVNVGDALALVTSLVLVTSMARMTFATAALSSSASTKEFEAVSENKFRLRNGRSGFKSPSQV
jgi:hypothetical protein